MSDEHFPASELTRAGWEYKLAVIWCLFCGVLFFPVIYFGFRAAAEWASFISTVATSMGLITAFIMVKGIPFLKKEYEGKKIKLYFMWLLLPLIGYVVGRNAVIVALPLIFAIFFGYQTELSFTVSNVSGDSIKCPNAIDVHDLPIFLSSFCNFPQSVTRDLKPGDRIMVGGRGTSLGVFASRIRRVE